MKTAVVGVQQSFARDENCWIHRETVVCTGLKSASNSVGTLFQFLQKESGDALINEDVSTIYWAPCSTFELRKVEMLQLINDCTHFGFVRLKARKLVLIGIAHLYTLRAILHGTGV